MKIVRSRRLVGLVGCAALALGVAGTAGAVPASAQARVTAAVAPSPDMASWGLNNTGELGDGTTTDRSRYGDIRALDNVVRVAAGWTPRYGHTLAVRSDGTVWAWGDNTHGDLGDGTTTTRLSAGLVLGAVTKVTDKFCNHLETVMSQTPAAGTAVSPGTAVSVTIGQAPANGCP